MSKQMNEKALEELQAAFAFDFECEAKAQDLSFVKGISFAFNQNRLSVRFIIEPRKDINALEICSELSTQFIARVTHIQDLNYQESTVIDPLSTPLENFNIGLWIYRS